MNDSVRVRVFKTLLGIAALAVIAVSAATTHAVVSGGGHVGGDVSILAEDKPPVIK